MSNIKSVTEAFSQQPVTLEVISAELSKQYYDKDRAVREIKQEMVYIDGKLITVYAGYNFVGQRIFQYLACAVHVHYLTPTP